MKNINIISKHKLQLLGNSISKSDLDLVLKNYNCLVEKNKNNECQIIYRGENKEKLFEIYNSSDFTSFGHSFFLIGNKGKGYLKKVYGKTEHLNKWDIASVSENDFIKIFEILNLIAHKINGVEKYSDFYNSNNPFIEYFKNLNNIGRFIHSIKQNRKPNRIRIRDYYLSQIHQFKDNKYYPVSMMLSTTTSFSEAEKFSKKGENRLIMVGWIPKSLNKNKYRINFKYLNSMNELLSKNNLPIVKKKFYPDQKEITLKGGLLPNYIVGYFCKNRINEDIFEINPALLKVNVENEDWVQNGLPINQDGIWEEIKKTHISGVFYVGMDGDFFDINE